MSAMRIAVLTVSDTRSLEDDKSGGYLAKQIRAAGHTLQAHEICPDDIYQLRARLSQWIADDSIDTVVTTGGTGITGRDVTPEAAEALFDKALDGFGELFRTLSYEDIGASTIQSRAIAGLANATLIFCLPGSSGAVRLGWEKILSSQLDINTKPCNFAMLLPRLKE